MELGDHPGVSLKGAYLHVRVCSRGEEEVREARQAWYRVRAKQHFTQRLGAWDDWCTTRRLPKPKLRLRKMAKRWGCALNDGTICLNPELVRAPSAGIDYVIAHEVCHLRHPHHGPEFWRLLAQVCPGWERLKARLEGSAS